MSRGSAAFALVDVDPLTQPGLVEATVLVKEAVGAAEHGGLHRRFTVREAVERRRALTSWHLETVLAVDAADGTPVGVLEVSAPLRDNRHAVDGSLLVHPSRRRQGVGTLLVTELLRRAGRLGRQVLWCESELAERHQAGTAAFAARHGFALVEQEHRQVLALPAAPVGPVGPVPAPDDGYRLTTYWDDVPPQLAAGRARLAVAMSTDAPVGDLDVEPEVWDVDRVREQFAVSRAQGRRVVETVALDRDDEPVAYTALLTAPAEHGMARQGDTLVVRSHRGHRLGRRVKEANLAALRRELPAVRHVVTYNAVDNGPMLAVNAALGFRRAGLLSEWQRRLDG